MRAVRWTLAVAFCAAGVYAFVLAWRIPIEAGGLLFGPMLLGVGGLAVIAGLSFVVPRRRPRRTGPPRWWPSA